MSRNSAIDALRGLVMIIMALDHTRDFFHSGAMQGSPEDLTRASAAVFLTRWITHFCAPVFFLLAGVGASLWRERHQATPAELSRFLWTRGLWLIVLEVTMLRFGFFLSLTNSPLFLTVLWALGLSMIACAALCRLPVRILAPLSLAVIAGHNLLDPVRAAVFGHFAQVWNILHQNGIFFVFGIPVFIAYPLVPWVVVMAAGYCLGALRDDWRALLRIGAGATAGFVVLRLVNVYGDPTTWSLSEPGGFLTFLRTTKYPPSLQFLLMTLGPALMLWAWLAARPCAIPQAILTIGRVPLFFFLVHFLVAHLLAFPAAAIRYGRVGFLWSPMPSVGGAADSYPAGFGYSLAATYGFWLLVLAISYPLCVWMAGVKRRRREWWISYL